VQRSFPNETPLRQRPAVPWCEAMAKGGIDLVIPFPPYGKRRGKILHLARLSGIRQSSRHRLIFATEFPR